MSISSTSRHFGEGNPTPASTDADVVWEIVRWSKRERSISAPPFLLSADAYGALRELRGLGDGSFETVSACHRAAVQKHLGPVLREIADGRPATTGELDMLTATADGDPIQAAFAAAAGSSAVDAADASPAGERIKLLRKVWVPFSRWWAGYFSAGADTSANVIDLWQLYLPFAEWILREKRRRRPDELFMVGFNGSPGAGKTVLTNALMVVLNQLLCLEAEGQPIARSGDDWYLAKSDRERLREQGYDCGLPGLTNRALPGTHDLTWLRRNLRELEHSSHDSVVRMGNFDKRIDDQPAGPDRYFEVHGKVGVFLFDLWFAGAGTDVDPMRLPDGLKRRVAENLREWRPVFDRMDALWVCDWPSFEQMVNEREAQEQLVQRRRGKRGMSPDHVRMFMAYMIEHAWDWRTTSPVPPHQAITFLSRRDRNHRVVEIEQGGHTP